MTNVVGQLYKKNVVDVHNKGSVFFTTMSWFLSPTLTNTSINKKSAKHKVYRLKAPITYLPIYFRLTI